MIFVKIVFSRQRKIDHKKQFLYSVKDWIYLTNGKFLLSCFIYEMKLEGKDEKKLLISQQLRRSRTFLILFLKRSVLVGETNQEIRDKGTNDKENQADNIIPDRKSWI